MRYVIVGNGPAGISAIEGIREYDSQGEIILIASEGKLPYNRILVPEYMVGEAEECELYIREEKFYQENAVEVIAGERAVAINVGEQSLTLENKAGGKRECKYDRLLLAMGSQNIMPSWVDCNIQGVYSLWNKADSLNIAEYLKHPGIKRAVIIGAGLVGLQAARALKVYGLEVTLLEKSSRLMPVQLDATASALLCQAAGNLGITVCLETEVIALKETEQKIKAVETREATIAADLVLIAVGVKPNIEWVNPLIARKQGILVNEDLQTNIPGIYAAGDIAQAYDALSGGPAVRAIWLNAVRQGKIAGRNMAGAREKYSGIASMNSIELFGVSLAALGQTVIRPEEQEGVYREQILSYPSSGSYHKLVFTGQNLVGLLFVGDIRQAGVLYHKLGGPLTEGYLGKYSSLPGEELLS